MYKDEIFIPIGDAVNDLLYNYNKDDCITTGLSSVDEITGGLKNGELVLLAARPGMGKTQFSLNIAYNAAKATGRRSVFFSLEHSTEQISARALWMLTGIDTHKILNRDNSSLDERLQKAAEDLQGVDLLVYDVQPMFDTVETLIENLKGVDNLGLIVVDYLQLCSLSRWKSIDRKAESRSILLVFKRAAKELGVPVIVVSQLSRKCESREDKRPDPFELMIEGLGVLSDDIIFLYKDSYYYGQYDDGSPGECMIAQSKDRSSGIALYKLENNGGRFTDI